MHGAPVEVKNNMEFHRVVVGAIIKGYRTCWCNLSIRPCSANIGGGGFTSNHTKYY